ncbi:MAG: bifunctional 2-keto-4-hydroxyglutarate aldolase/2-keto-3-deoxy-6-phosphogluconate aldolase [Eubacteriaceae bacterium]|jgi:2-dehydro-3-deoxyphosphogluconate aldolase/(4S)-4-hydroxy-2-oxoglutarate aldolase|nr:bifunctional 2-keto-4-hydroxyglutarate aldolase/2-keto-3-deoxy-6-phosphogluconate aldolase [Eubacteriaceae bacterium]
MSKILDQIRDAGIVAVIRGDSVDQAMMYCEACVAGGISFLEITFTVPGALDVLDGVVRKMGDTAVPGAGTVLDAVTARIAILHGAKFIVSPAFDEEVAKLCNLYRIPYIPGCLTPTEAVRALQFGAAAIKLFPGSAFGPSYVGAIKAPLPQAEIIPTGGVSLDNVQEWLQKGCLAVGVGGKLASGTREEVTTTAKAFKAKIDEIR